MKRTPLKRRTPLRAFGRRGAAFYAYVRVRKDVESRANGRCEIGAPPCERRGSECHHLLPRSQGGPDSIGNCVWVCRPCHRYVHEHPAESYERGWLRRRAA